MDCFLTGNISEFSKYVDIAQLPGLSGDEFLADLSGAGEGTLFLIKKSKEFSVEEALLSETQFDDGTKVEDIYALRDIYANETRRAESLADMADNTGYRNLISCMGDKEMTGILIFFPPVTVRKKECLGPIEITGSLEYVLPVVKISNVVFREGKIDTSDAVSCGEIFLKQQPDVVTDGFQHFSLLLQESCAAFRQGNLYLPQMLFQVVFYRFFEQEVVSEVPLMFVGNYLGTAGGSGKESEASAFRMVSSVRMALSLGALWGIALNDGSAEVCMEGGLPKLKMNFNGCMMFAPNDDAYDYFSYENLKFNDLKIDFTLSKGTESMESHYRDIRLTEKDSTLREASFLAMAPHGDISFVSFQDANTPEKLGFWQMNAGCVQQVITHGAWFGMVVPMELFHGIKMRLLFAFGFCIFYAGAAFGAGGKASLMLSSLIDLRWKDIQIQKTGGKYALGFRGLKAGCLGMDFPEGSADMLLVPGGDGNSLAWYALYDNRKENGQNGEG